MLHFLITMDHDYTLTRYFDEWGASLASGIRVVHYETRPWHHHPSPGTWVFTDLERLTPSEYALARNFAARLATDPTRWRVVNDPARALGRYALLQRMAETGVNDFHAYRLDEVPHCARYPLFIRQENDHVGSRSPLLFSPEELRQFLTGPGRVERSASTLAVEFIPYRRTDGLYVKYSAMRIGPTLIPRHVLFSHNWELKYPDLIDDGLVAEEDEYLNSVLHNAALLDIFETAGISYGRIDYTVVENRLQVFEINTNPVLVPRLAKLAPQRWRGQAESARRLNDAFINLSADMPGPTEIERRAMQRADKAQGIRRRVHRLFGGRRWANRKR